MTDDKSLTTLQLPRQTDGDLAEYTGSLTGDQVVILDLLSVIHRYFLIIITVVDFI